MMVGTYLSHIKDYVGQDSDFHVKFSEAIFEGAKPVKYMVH